MNFLSFLWLSHSENIKVKTRDFCCYFLKHGNDSTCPALIQIQPSVPVWLTQDNVSRGCESSQPNTQARLREEPGGGRHQRHLWVSPSLSKAKYSSVLGACILIQTKFLLFL